MAGGEVRQERANRSGAGPAHLPASLPVFYFSGFQLVSCEKIGVEERGVKGQIVNIFSSANITFQLSIIREEVIDTM